ncbi:MAG: hypothetical protein ABMB14_31130 [Myxococcota bacterium]
MVTAPVSPVLPVLAVLPGPVLSVLPVAEVSVGVGVVSAVGGPLSTDASSADGSGALHAADTRNNAAASSLERVVGSISASEGGAL